MTEEKPYTLFEPVRVKFAGNKNNQFREAVIVQLSPRVIKMKNTQCLFNCERNDIIIERIVK